MNNKVLTRQSKRNDEEKHLLTNYQHFIQEHEKMAARWLIEEWDGKSIKLPSWLKNKIWEPYPQHIFENPSNLAKEICLKLLENHKHEISLQ